jgi:phage FluMu gp28-like protein
VDNRFPRFSRMRVTIDDAIAGGLQIDLAELQDLFDADSFQQLYRCQWFDDEESYFSFDEINACVRDCLRATTQAVLYGGLDVGRVRDASEIVLVEPGAWADDDDQGRDAVITRVMHTMKKTSFDEQMQTVRSYLKMYSVRRFLIDATGMGMQLAETLQREFPGVVQPVWMTRESKEEMAIVLKQMFEKRQIVIPNDQSLIAQINSIKRIPKEKGFSYDSGRNAEIGHADKFWALALACRELGTVGRRMVMAKVF